MRPVLESVRLLLQHTEHGSCGLSSLVDTDEIGVLVDDDHEGLAADTLDAEPPAYQAAPILQDQDVFARIYPGNSEADCRITSDSAACGGSVTSSNAA
jgi:hypothetical protein